jgi:hypothetical protein
MSSRTLEVREAGLFTGPIDPGCSPGPTEVLPWLTSEEAEYAFISNEREAAHGCLKGTLVALLIEGGAAAGLYLAWLIWHVTR